MFMFMNGVEFTIKYIFCDEVLRPFSSPNKYTVYSEYIKNISTYR